ncbi:hypothetical protein ACFXEL_33045 [Streptomyces sp. NPDC059382]|uniref:hypothetical protein n=1 Tax=Streptomyces sp. NPDC059382 TaxID=3346816 RepID=UPI0036BACF79
MNSQLRFTAWFKDPAPDAGEDDVVSQPVVGWRDSDGAAMVLDRTAGRIVAAAEQLGFMEIEAVADEQPLGVVPGTGWRVRKSGQGPLPEAHDPVAFVVYSTHVVPVVSLPPAGDFRGEWRSNGWTLHAKE